MTLTLIDLHRGGADRYSWTPPFDSSIAYEHEHWWSDVPYLLDDPGGINPDYTGVPDLGDERLEIQFIGVATAARGRGVGTRVVRALEDGHRGRRLFAYSEDAGRFWLSLGWEPFYRPGRPPARTLFIQPAR